MFLNIIYSHAGKTAWLSYLLPCPFKKLTGIDCPGCGFQRSVIALVQGDMLQSFNLYPATLPLLTAVLITLLDKRFMFDKCNYIKKSLYMFTGIIMAAAYLVKMTA